MLGLVALAGCNATQAEAEARIRVGTALVPAVDFVEIVSTLGDGQIVHYRAQPSDPFDVPLTPHGDPGQLVAVFENVSTGVVTDIDVDLLDPSGAAVRDYSGGIQPDVHTRATNYFFQVDR